MLKPARIESDTGYRYYSAAQLPRLNRILVLRDLGLSLEQIAQALREELGAAELRGMLLMRRSEVEQTIEAESQRLRQIEARIAQIETEGKLAADDVLLKREPARRLLSTRQTVASFAEGVRLIGELVEAVPRLAGARAIGQLVAIAHAPEFEPESIDVEFGFFVESGQRRAAAPRRRPRAWRARSSGGRASRHLRAHRAAAGGAPHHRAHRQLHRVERLPDLRSDARGLSATPPARANGQGRGGDAVPGRKDLAGGRAQRS